MINLTYRQCSEAHVRFLAQPELNGRGLMSGGLLRARRHIVDVFKTSGLHPWKKERDFTQSIGIGANVIGILPGQDPQLAGQILLVSAHYDHLGNGKPGAADDASGVGVLLEMASRFAHTAEKPKRTICFAVFDCEEMGLFGSTVFTCRKDFDASEIAAVVNMDILGRRGFDCMENSLFLGKTHTAPSLYETSRQAARKAGLNLLPYHALLTGPRADHIPFAALDVPSLFFSSGPFKDYHTKEDNLQNMNWELLRRSSHTIYDTVRQLANMPSPIFGVKESLGSKDDLQTLLQIVNTLPGKDPDSQSNVLLAEKAIEKVLSTTPLDHINACAVLPEVFLAMGPQMDLLTGASLETYNDQDKTKSRCQNFVQLLFFEKHSKDIMELYRKIVSQYLENNPMRNAFPDQKIAPEKTKQPHSGSHADLEVLLNPLQDDEVFMMPLKDKQYHLGVLIPVIHVKLWQNYLRYPKVSIDVGWKPYSCRGDIDTLIDYCILMWENNGWGTIDYIKEEVPCWDLAWRRVLNRISPDMPQFDSMKDALAYRIQKTGCKDKEQWKQAVFKNNNPDILRAEHLIFPLKNTPSREILLDSTMPSDLRAGALSGHFNIDKKEGGIMLTKQMVHDLKSLISDLTPIEIVYNSVSDLPPTTELAVSINKLLLLSKEKCSQQTIGAAAQKRLSEIAAYLGKNDLAEDTETLYVPAGITLTCFPKGSMTIFKRRTKTEFFRAQFENVVIYDENNLITRY